MHLSNCKWVMFDESGLICTSDSRDELERLAEKDFHDYPNSPAIVSSDVYSYVVGLNQSHLDLCESLKKTIDALTAIETWCNAYGSHLCPGHHPDTFGEGMREAKDQIKSILRKCGV